MQYSGFDLCIVIFTALFYIINGTISSGEYEHITTQDEYGQEITFRRRIIPTFKPTNSPTNAPTDHPSSSPTNNPTLTPTLSPTLSPTLRPTKEPTVKPTKSPTMQPTFQPTSNPTEQWDSKGSPNKQKSKSAKKKSQLEDSKVLKQALETIKKRQSQLNAKLDMIEIYNYHINLSHDIVLTHEDKLVKNVDKKYSLIIVEVPVVKDPTENICSCITSIDNALYHQITLMHALRKGEFDDHFLFQDGLKNSVLFMAKLDDQSIADSIIKEFNALSKYILNPEQSAFDGQINYWFSTGYEQTREEMAKSQTVTLEHINLFGGCKQNDIILVSIINKISLKHLINAKMNYIEGIFTSTSYGNDGKIPIKIKNVFSEFKDQAQEIIDQQLPRFHMNSLIYNSRPENMTEAEMQQKIDAHVMARNASDIIHDFCNEISMYCAHLQTTQFVYEWRKADKKKNRGIIAISIAFGQSSRLNTLLNNIGYSSSLIQEYIIYPVEEGNKNKYKISNFTLKVPEIEVEVKSKSSSKNRRKKHKDKEKDRNKKQKVTNHTSLAPQLPKNSMDDVAIKIFLTKGDEDDIIEQEIKILNNKEYDLIIVDFGVSITRAGEKENRFALKTFVDIVFDRSHQIFERYRYMLRTSDINDEAQKRVFIQQTIDFVGIGIYYFSQFTNNDARFDNFINLLKASKSINDKFIKVIQWQYNKKAKDSEKFQKLEILQPSMMDSVMMQSAFDYINIYMASITQMKINQLTSHMDIMDRDLLQSKQNRINEIFQKILELMNKWGAFMTDYWITNNNSTLAVINMRGSRLAALVPELMKMKRFLETVAVINEWKDSEKYGIVAIAIHESIFDNEFTELLNKMGYSNISFAPSDFAVNHTQKDNIDIKQKRDIVKVYGVEDDVSEDRFKRAQRKIAEDPQYDMVIFMSPDIMKALHAKNESEIRNRYCLANRWDARCEDIFEAFYLYIVAILTVEEPPQTHDFVFHLLGVVMFQLRLLNGSPLSQSVIASIEDSEMKGFKFDNRLCFIIKQLPELYDIKAINTIVDTGMDESMAKSVTEFLGIVFLETIKDTIESVRNNLLSIDTQSFPSMDHDYLLPRLNKTILDLEQDKWYESMYDVIIGTGKSEQSIEILKEFTERLLQLEQVSIQLKKFVIMAKVMMNWRDSGNHGVVAIVCRDAFVKKSMMDIFEAMNYNQNDIEYFRVYQVSNGSQILSEDYVTNDMFWKCY